MKRKSMVGRGFQSAAAASLLALSGCAGFFVENTTTTTTTSSTGDYIYVVNNSANTLGEYVVGSGALTVVSGSPLTLENGLAARSVTVTRPNTFVYVGGNGAIDCFSIGTGGALTAVSAGRVTAVANFVSLDTSPDGKWLLALDSTGLAIYVYGINTGTGALTPLAPISLNLSAAAILTAPSLRISPTGTSVMAALNSGGAAAYTFQTSTGFLTYLGNVSANTSATTYYDNAVAYDSTGTYAYVARANSASGASGITSYAVTSGTGALTQVQALAASGTAPNALTFDTTGTYLYTSNAGDLTLTGYTASSGTLTALASAPYGSGVKLVALTRDNSGKYIVGVGSTGTTDVILFGLDAFTSGKLNPAAVASTGSAGVVAVAATRTTAGL